MAYAGVEFMFLNFWDGCKEDAVRPVLEKVILPPKMSVWKADATAVLESLRLLCLGDALRVKYWV